MFIKNVPVVPGTTVLNEEIIYDSNYSTDCKAGNIATSIKNVGEYSLETCIMMILEDNPDVIFNAIQYSKEDKTVFFHTNKEIITNRWLNRECERPDYIKDYGEFKNEIARLFVDEKPKYPDCISLYDIKNLMVDKTYQYNHLVKEYQNWLESLLCGEIYHPHVYIRWVRDDCININYYSGMSDPYQIIFAKEKNSNDFFVKQRSTCAKDQYALVQLRNVLPKLYNDLDQFSGLNYQSRKLIKSINSSFLVNMDNEKMKLFSSSSYYYTYNNFEIDFSFADNKCSIIKCNSTSAIDAISGREEDILSRVFIKIDDCPDWCKPILYNIRQNQLNGKSMTNSEKKKSIIKTLFPWL